MIVHQKGRLIEGILNKEIIRRLNVIFQIKIYLEKIINTKNYDN